MPRVSHEEETQWRWSLFQCTVKLPHVLLQVFSTRSEKAKETRIYPIVGGVAAAVVLCLAGACIFYMFRRHRRRLDAAKNINVHFILILRANSR